MDAAQTVVLYVRRDCFFSHIAISRVRDAVQAFAELRMFIRDQSQAEYDGIRIPVTPTLLLPGGRRLTGTPSVERLQ
ncbi:MAG TPA: hypothetical protein VIO32_10235, partial [Candidatus Baltobacteraceae bacterium]